MRLLAIVLSNGATSIVSLLITVLIGRQDGPSQLGVFGVVFAVLLIAQLFAQEVGVNRALSNPSDPQQRQVAYSRSLIVALIIGVLMAITGFVIMNPIVIFTGVAIPGYIAFTFLRLLTMTEGAMSRGFLADGLLISAVAVASIVAIVLDASSLSVVITWALVLPVSAALLQKHLGLRFRSRWFGRRGEYTGISFGFQNLFGSGSAHISTFLLASVFGSVLVGAIRGAATLMGPINLVTNSVNTIAIRQLAAAGLEERRRTIFLWFTFSTVIASVGALLTWLLAVCLGELILGASWPVVGPLVPWIALDAALVAVAVAAQAAHRVDKQSGSAWKVSVASGIVRLVLLPIGGWLAGAVGVAIAAAFTTLLTSCAWWISYSAYRRGANRADRELLSNKFS